MTDDRLIHECPICGGELRLFQTVWDVSRCSVAIDEESELVEPLVSETTSSEVQESYVECINGHSEPDILEALRVL